MQTVAIGVNGATLPSARARRNGSRSAGIRRLPGSVTAMAVGYSVKPTETYVPPSSAPAENELQRLAAFSNIVPDTVVPEKFRKLGVASAAVVSHTKLMNAALSPSREFEAALAGALAYPRCRIPGASVGVSLDCLVDKSMVNLGADLASIVSGRVTHEIDGRLLHDTKKTLMKAKEVVDLYKEMGVPRSRLLIGVEATWEGIEAVKVLEQEGIECHVRSIYCLHQAAAAVAAGAALIQPSVLSISDWYAKHPNAISKSGPRADAGTLHNDPAADAEEVARNLVAATIAYMQTHKVSKTKTMAAVRTVEDVQALAGVDFIIAPVSVLETLQSIPTMAGYNDGISGAAPSLHVDEVPPIYARAARLQETVRSFSDGKKMKKEDFNEALNAGPWAELLGARLRAAEGAANRAEEHFKKLWPPTGTM